ncbi:MAG: hypothetical protein ACTHNI_07610 [Cellulosimicrobium cellulans]
MLRRTGAAAAALVAMLTGAALTGCTAPAPDDVAEAPVSTQPSVGSTPSAAPTPDTTPSAAPAPATTPECGPTSGDVLNGMPLDVGMYENMVDLGPREGANGTVSYAADGTLASYVVAAGDHRDAIVERLCLGPYAYEALNAVRRGSVHSVDPKNEAYLTPLFEGDALNLSPYTITSVGDVNGVVHSYETVFILPPQH